MTGNGFPHPLRAALISMHTDPVGPLGGDVSGGMNVYVREVARALPPLGVRADIFTRATDAASPPVVELAPGARLIRIPAGPREPLHKDALPPFEEEFAAGVRAFAAAEGSRYRVVSAHYWLSGAAGGRLARAWGLPLALRFHTVAVQKNRALPEGSGLESGLRLRTEAELARRADALLASSPAEARLLIGELGADEARIHVVPCGVDPERFRPLPREEARARLGLGRDAALILSVGRIEPIKGLGRLVESLAALRPLRPGLSFRAIHIGGEPRDGRRPPGEGCLAGEDFSSPAQRSEVGRILRLAEEAGVAGEMCFAGSRPQEELPLYYSAADVLAIPSRYETFSLIALEAAACGLPAVAYDVGGISQAVEDGESGLLVPDGESRGFAEAILRVLGEPGLRARLAHRGRERALVRTWPAVAQKETEVWRRLRPARAKAAPGSRGADL